MAAGMRIVLVLPRELVETLGARARRKGLSRAAYIRMILTEHVQVEEDDTQPREAR